MENNYCVDPNENTEFKTRLNVGEVVIVDYTDTQLNYNRKYVSVVKKITIDDENNIYTCRLDNFNIDFSLRHQVPYDKFSATYNSYEENIYSFVFKIEDYEHYLNYKLYYINIHTMYEIKKDYQVLVEAMKLKEQLQQGQ